MRASGTPTFVRSSQSLSSFSKAGEQLGMLPSSLSQITWSQSTVTAALDHTRPKWALSDLVRS